MAEKSGEIYSSDSPGGIGTGNNSGGTTYIESGKQVQYDKETNERVTRNPGEDWHYTNQDRAKGSSGRHRRD